MAPQRIKHVSARISGLLRDGAEEGMPPVTRQAGQRGGAATASQATARAIDLAPVIASLWASGVTSLQAIADELNGRQIPTARGGKWSRTQVSRVLARVHRAAD
jgi:hypothetical protein